MPSVPRDGTRAGIRERPAFARKLKRAMGHAAWRLIAPRASRDGETLRRGPPVVAGFFSAPSGLGESARLCHAALAALGLSPRHIDFSRRFGQAALGDLFGDDGEPDWTDAGPLIIHANPPELPAVCVRLGKRAMRGRLVVGYWAWELERVPRSWLPAFRHVHEIWVPSRFTAEAVRPFTRQPVRVVPHPLSAAPATNDRSAFGLAGNRLAVLSACDLRSSVERKNLFGNINAFRAAFGRAEDATLVVKLGGFGDYPRLARAIEEKIAGLNNVAALGSPLSPRKMADLIATADIVLSLHRSEGFGLLPAQAMLQGKPAIATYWSGNVDYMGRGAGVRVPPSRLVPVHDPQGIYPYPELRWAEPDLEHAVEALRRLAGDPDQRRVLGTKAAEAIGRHCSPARYWQASGPLFRELCGAASGSGEAATEREASASGLSPGRTRPGAPYERPPRRG